MKKKDKKWVWISVIIFGIIFLTPFLEIIGFTTPGLCSETPYNKDCVCLSVSEKYVIDFANPINVFKYGCREKIIEKEYTFPMDINIGNINDYAIQGEMLGYSRDILRQKCSSCDTFDCSGLNWVSYEFFEPGVTQPGYAYVECLSQTGENTGQSWWRVVFSFNEGSLHPYMDSYCWDSDKTTKCKIS